MWDDFLGRVNHPLRRLHRVFCYFRAGRRAAPKRLLALRKSGMRRSSRDENGWNAETAHLSVGRVSGAPVTPPAVTLDQPWTLIIFPCTGRMVSTPITPLINTVNRRFIKAKATSYIQQKQRRCYFSYQPISAITVPTPRDPAGKPDQRAQPHGQK
jgi:hypothetical protein